MFQNYPTEQQRRFKHNQNVVITVCFYLDNGKKIATPN